MGHHVVSVLCNHMVVASKRSNIVIPRATINHIIVRGSFAHLTRYTLYSLADPIVLPTPAVLGAAAGIVTAPRVSAPPVIAAKVSSKITRLNMVSSPPP